MSFFESLQRARDRIEAKIEEQLRPLSNNSQGGRGEGRGGGPPPVPPRPEHLFPGHNQPALPPRPEHLSSGYSQSAFPRRPPSPRRRFVNAVYYPSWHVYQGKTPGSMDARNVTHVFYAFIGVNEDGSIRHVDRWGDLDHVVDGEKGGLAALAKLKRDYPHIKTVLSVGGGASSKEFPALAASEQARRKFAHQARQFCDQHRLDGIDIDWEHPQNEQEGHHFLKLLEACRETLPPQTHLLTAALPVGEWVLRHIDLGRVAHLLDFFNLMAYDFAGSWSSSCGHQAQLHVPPNVHPEHAHSGSRAIDYILSRGFQPHQLLLGIPNYARTFPRARAPGQKFEGAGEMEYRDIPDEWVDRARIDEGLVAAWYVDHQDKGFVSFEVPSTVRIKARYVMARGLGGLFYWTWTGDKQGRLSLVATGKEMLGS